MLYAQNFFAIWNKKLLVEDGVEISSDGLLISTSLWAFRLQYYIDIYYELNHVVLNIDVFVMGNFVRIYSSVAF